MPHSRHTSRTPSPRDTDDAHSEDSLLHASPPRSPSQLVLVQDPDDLPELELWQSDDDGEDLEDGRSQPGEDISEGPRTTNASPPLGVLSIVLFLIAPTLKLGATQLLNQSLQQPPKVLPFPTAIAVVSLILFAGLNALAVQIWLMLGQYVRRWTIEGVVGEAFVGVSPGQRSRSRSSPWKKAVVRTTRGLVVAGASLLCAAYLRESTDLLVPLVPKSSYTFERAGVAAVLGFVVAPLLARGATLASRRVVWSNFISILLYVVVALVVIVHRFQAEDGSYGNDRATERGQLVPRKPMKVHLTGGAWEWLNFALFAFTNQFFTYPLFSTYAQSIAARNLRRDQSRRVAPPSSPLSPTAPSRFKKPKRKVPPTFQFFLLACVAAMISIVLLAFPLFLGATRFPSPTPPPENPAPTPTPSPAPHQRRSLPHYIEHTYNALRVLQAFYLLLGIPPLWASTIAPRLHPTNISIRWVNDIKWHWVLFVCLISLASFAPTSLGHFTTRMAGFSLVAFAYALPAVLHLTLHAVRSPLAIILAGGPDSTDDMLLRRKERSLQRKRWIRRAGWDLSVWIILGPVGLISLVWWFGRIVGLW